MNVLSGKFIKEERETYFHIDEVENAWTCTSSIPKDIRKLEKQNWRMTACTKYTDGTIAEATFTAPRNCLTLRCYNPDKPKKVLSEEHKRKLLNKTRSNIHSEDN